MSDLSPCKMKLFSPSLMDYHGLWDELLHKSDRGASTVMNDESNFRVDLDVQHFAPEEISVKIVDSYVIVEAKHEEKEDEYGWISRQFTRRYIIPKQCDIDQVSSKLSSDGVLSIIAPRIPKLDSVSEGIILNIEHTGKPRLHDTEEKSEKPEVKENGE